MKIVFFIIYVSSAMPLFSQQENQKVKDLADSTLLKAEGRIITLIDNNDLCVFTDYEVFLETVRSHTNSPAAKKIYDVFFNYKGTGNIIADSVANDPGLYEKWTMVKGVVISSGKVLILNKATGLREIQMDSIYFGSMCCTNKIGGTIIISYCLGQN